MDFKDIPRFTKSASYRIDVEWKYLEQWLQGMNERDGELNLDPDFQRAHVWTEEKQIKYVEYQLRGGISSKDIYFNHPGWNTNYEGTLELVDGKQRLEAVRKFMRNKLPIFNGHYLKDFTGYMRSHIAGFKININDLKTRKEVLQWYLDLNEGGVVHTKEELDKVKQLLAKEG